MNPRIVHLNPINTPLPTLYRYERVNKFRHKASSRINILKNIIPKEFEISDDLLFICSYFKDDINLIRKDVELVKVEQGRILELGENLLNLRLYNVLLFNNNNNNNNDDDNNVMNKLDSIDPRKYNTWQIRYKFINQFNEILDSKDLLSKISFNNYQLTIKLEQSSRDKILFMIIGIIYCQFGNLKSNKFIDNWIIRGRWSNEIYKHKGLMEIYTDLKLKKLF